MTSTACPANVWNHTSGCSCDPASAATAEADVDLALDQVTVSCPKCGELGYSDPADCSFCQDQQFVTAADGQQVRVLPTSYHPTNPQTPGTSLLIQDLADGKAVVTYLSADSHGEVTDPGEKMDAVRDLLGAHSGAEAVFPPNELSPHALHDYLDGTAYSGHVVGIEFVDGQARTKNFHFGSEWGEFKENVGMCDAVVVIDPDELHRHRAPDGRLDFSQIENEINDYSGATYTVNHDVIDTSTGEVLAHDADDYDGSITTVIDGQMRVESAHADIDERLDSFYSADEFDDWGYGQDLED